MSGYAAHFTLENCCDESQVKRVLSQTMQSNVHVNVFQMQRLSRTTHRDK